MGWGGVGVGWGWGGVGWGVVGWGGVGWGGQPSTTTLSLCGTCHWPLVAAGRTLAIVCMPCAGARYVCAWVMCDAVGKANPSCFSRCTCNSTHTHTPCQVPGRPRRVHHQDLGHHDARGHSGPHAASGVMGVGLASIPVPPRTQTTHSARVQPTPPPHPVGCTIRCLEAGGVRDGRVGGGLAWAHADAGVMYICIAWWS